MRLPYAMKGDKGCPGYLHKHCALWRKQAAQLFQCIYWVRDVL